MAAPLTAAGVPPQDPDPLSFPPSFPPAAARGSHRGGSRPGRGATGGARFPRSAATAPQAAGGEGGKLGEAREAQRGEARRGEARG